jgi:hypothetical protein
MNRRCSLSISAMTALWLALLPGSAVAQQKITKGNTCWDLDARLKPVHTG